MMEVLIRNAEGNLSQDDRDYAAKKLSKLDRYFSSASKVEIVHREAKLNHRVEVTVFADGLTVRGEESDANIRAAIDLVGEKIETRLRKLKRRLVDRHRSKGNGKILPEALTENHLEDEDHKIVIKERKQFLIKPMEPEEAALEMEMLGHPFFVFRNDRTNRTEVLYRRKDGAYGILQPEG